MAISSPSLGTWPGAPRHSCILAQAQSLRRDAAGTVREQVLPKGVKGVLKVGLRRFSGYNRSMQERDFFDERQELKPATLNCDKCRHIETYDIRWLVRTKKIAL